MARLPNPGSDSGTWGSILNDYLAQVHNTDGSLKSNVIGSSQIQGGAVTNSKILDGAVSETKLDASTQAKLNSSGGPVLSTDISDSTATGRSVLTAADAATARTAIGAGTASTAADVGLGNVDNTSDATKNAAVATLTNKTLTTPTIDDFTNATHTHTSAAGGGQLTITTASNATGTPSSSTYLRGDNAWTTIATGDASTNTATSIDDELVLFSGTGGKTLKRASGTGVATVTSGVLGTVAAPTGAIVGTNDSQALTNKDLTSGTNIFPTFNQSTSGNAATATALQTARNIQTNLASGSASSFDGTAGITPGVTGTLPVGNGGTGAASLTGVVIGNGTGAFTTVTAPSGAIVGTSDSQVLTSKTLTNPTVNNYTEGVVAIGTVTTLHTFSLTSGTVHTATLTASTACTFTMPPAAAGKSFVLYLRQAAGGSGTATFTGVVWSAAGAPTITTTGNRMDIISFHSDGTNWYGSYVQGYAP